MIDNFYRAFEERHRGSRELIGDRLKVYLPFIQPLLTVYPDAKALDLGCGRGEWLELLSEQGFDAKGVDLDDGMLQACRERGLDVTLADAIAYMRSLSDESICIVSGFHIAEHLPFEQLQQLVLEAKRVLVPAGLLILETPNPENISVGTSSFYLDPTHERPIPPGLLSFLPEHYGYSRVKIIRLQEDKALINKLDVSLQDVIAGVSPDYAVVAQKAAPEALIALTNGVFKAEYGISLGELAGALDRRLVHIELRSVQAETTAHEAEIKAHKAETTAHEAEIKAHKAETTAHEAQINALQAVEVSRQLHAQLEAMILSRSWRITKPLRWVSGQIKRLREEGLRRRSKAFVKKFFRKINHELLLRPVLRRRLLSILKVLGLHRYATVLLGKLHVSQIDSALNVHAGSQSIHPFKNLPPKAQQCFVELQRAMEGQKEGDI